MLNTPLQETADRIKKDYTQDSSVTAKAVTIEIYEVSESYDSVLVLKKIKEYCNEKGTQYAIMKHDQDIFSKDTFSKDHRLLGRKGQKKDTHYHINLYFKNRVHISDLSIAFGIEDRWIQKLKKDQDFDNMLIYCTHIRYDESEKHHYEPSLYDSNIQDYINALYDVEIEKQESAQDNIVCFLSKYLVSFDKKMSYQSMIDVLLKNDYEINQILKYYRILSDLVREHNNNMDYNDLSNAVAKARADADMVNQDRLDKISGLADTFGTTKIEINGKTYMLTNIEKEGKK